MIYDDSWETMAALMKWFRHEHPEYGGTYSPSPEYYAKMNIVLAEYKITYIDHEDRERAGYWFATEDDRLLFRLKWGNGRELYNDV